MLDSYGLFNAYYVSIKAFNGDGCIILVVTARDVKSKVFERKTEEKKVQLHAPAKAIDFVGIRKFPGYYLAKPERRELVLEPEIYKLLRLLLKKDCTYKEAADELGLKIATVNYLMKAFREAYDANTTLSAVYRMMERDGLVDVD